MKWLSPAWKRALRSACPPLGSRSGAFMLVAAVTLALLWQGLPGGSLPVVLFFLTVLTLTVSGVQVSSLTRIRRLWLPGEVTP